MKEDEFYIVAVGADKPGSQDTTDVKIYDENGKEEEYTEEDPYYVNYEFVSTGTPEVIAEGGGGVDMTGSQVVQKLSGNQLTSSSVTDGDTLYLLKGGKYTYEDGVTVTPYAKDAIKLNAKKNQLTAKKDSLLTIKKGDEEKVVLLRAVTIRKKNRGL